MERTWKPTTAGIMTIITGAMGIAGGVFLFLLSGVMGALGGIDWSQWVDKWGVLVFGIIALCGGISAIKRRRWGLSLAGSILSLFIMPILGLLAIIFVSLGKGEFE